MPKIKQRKSIYKARDFCKWIEGERVSMNATQQDFADIIGCKRQAYARKIQDADLTLIEVLQFIEKLEPDDEKKLYLMKM